MEKKYRLIGKYGAIGDGMTKHDWEIHFGCILPDDMTKTLMFEEVKEPEKKEEKKPYDYKNTPRAKAEWNWLCAFFMTKSEPEKETLYPKGVRAFKKSDGTYSEWDYQKQFNTYNGWVRYNLGEKREIYEVQNDKGEVFKVKDWVGFWIEGFGINTNNEIYAYCTWAFPVKTILLSELRHKEKPKDSGNWRSENSDTLLKEAIYCSLTSTMPKAETFDYGCPFDVVKILEQIDKNNEEKKLQDFLQKLKIPNFVIDYFDSDKDYYKLYCESSRENRELKKKIEGFFNKIFVNCI